MIILKWTVYIAFIFLFALFVIDNADQKVNISFYQFKIENVHVMLVILVSFTMGFLLSATLVFRQQWISFKKSLKLKKTMRQQNKEINKQEKEIDSLKKEIPLEQKQIPYDNEPV